MIKSESVFLGRSGRVFGPFTQNELDELSSKGRLSEYHWIWDWKTMAWKSIEAPPPAPTEAQGTSSGGTGTHWELVEVIGFDSSRLVRGKLKWITETGCTLRSQQKEDGPLFPIHGSIKLNLYDPHQLTGVTVSVKLKDVSYEDNHWNYYTKWNGIPLLKKIL